MIIRTSREESRENKSTYNIPELPLELEVETKPVMRKCFEAGCALAELKGVAESMPNEAILINTLSLQEAKDSSAVENIITTNDELYQSDLFEQHFTSTAAKEVHMYAKALRDGYQKVRENGFLTNNTIIQIQSQLEGNEAGFRTQGGTSLKNDQTGEIIYTPPQTFEQIQSHMANLERFINDDSFSDINSLIKMTIIHHQFESIHPFFDGNGRTGRIISILYLVQEGALDAPILYLSRYINRNKPAYYRLLQAVRDDGHWEAWILFMLEAVRETSYQTLRLIQAIKELMQQYKQMMRTELPGIYSQDVLNLIFRHPYTKITHAMESLGVSRPTATKYLDELVRIGLMQKIRIGRENYYVNVKLMHCLANVQDL